MRTATGQFGAHNAAHATLTPEQVQQVRGLAGAGFTANSIAASFNVTGRCIRDILRGRAWDWLLPAPVELPTLTLDQAQRLRHRRRRHNREQARALVEYSRRLAEAIDIEAERAGAAVAILQDWTPRPPRRQREVATTF